MHLKQSPSQELEEVTYKDYPEIVEEVEDLELFGSLIEHE